MQILQQFDAIEWNSQFSEAIIDCAIDTIEQGKIIFLPKLAFLIHENEKQFFCASTANPNSKNISFDYVTRSLRGVNKKVRNMDELTAMLQRYAECCDRLIKRLFRTYSEYLVMGRTSFRPVEISGRVSSYRKDDSRLHVDAFPATPNQGQRILRIFTNINPMGQNRVWRVGDTFTNVASRFLPTVSKFFPGGSFLLKMFGITKSYRTEYDHIMLQIHDHMKGNLTYQAEAPQQEIQFPAGSSWIMQTDQVSHAAMLGQFVLEQTFYLPVGAMKCPELSPLRVLEKLTGRKLNNVTTACRYRA